MTKKILTKTISFLFLSILVCNIFFISFSEATESYSEDFEDDVNNTDPSDDWYTYSETADLKCDSGLHHSGSLSFLDPSVDANGYGRFTLDESQVVTNLTAWFICEVDNVWAWNGYLDLYSEDGRIIDIDIVDYGSATEDVLFNSNSQSFHWAMSTWYELNIELNWTDDTFRGRVNGIWSSWYAFSTTGSVLENFDVRCSDTGIGTVMDWDDFTLYYELPPPTSPFIEDFDDDTVGQNSSEDWYTYSEGGNNSVADTDSKSGTNSLYVDGFPTNMTIFNLDTPITERIDLSFWFKPMNTTGNHSFHFYNHTNSILTFSTFSGTDPYDGFIRDEGVNTTVRWYPNYWYSIRYMLDIANESYNLAIYGTEHIFVDAGLNLLYSNTAGTLSNGEDLDRIVFYSSGGYFDDVVLNTPINYPVASLNSPANDSQVNLPVTLSVNITDNDYNDTCLVHFYIAVKTAVGYAVNYEGFDVIYTDGTASISYYDTLFINKTVYWFVVLNDSFLNSDVYPKSGFKPSGAMSLPSGLENESSFNESDFYCWAIRTPPNNNATITVNYPLDTNIYTTVEWADDHELSFTYNDLDGDDAYLMIQFLRYGSRHNYPYVYSPLTNGTYTIDLKPYIHFDDTIYGIRFDGYEYHEGWALYREFANITFIIGDSDLNKGWHVAFRDITPENENNTALGYLNTGIQFYWASNYSTYPNSDYRVAIYLTDWDGKLIAHNRELYPTWDSDNLWQKIKKFENYLMPKSWYKIWIGVADDRVDYTNFQFDNIYGTTFIMDNFSYHYQGYIKDYRVTPDHEGDWDYYGFSYRFGTFPIGTDIDFPGDEQDEVSIGESTGNEGGGYVDPLLTLYNIPGVGFVIGLLVIIGFALIPIIITRSVPPLPILFLFTGMGVVVSWKMGFFPLWVFVLALIGILVFIFYRVWNWASKLYGETVVDEGSRAMDFGKEELGKPIKEAWSGRNLKKEKGTRESASGVTRGIYRGAKVGYKGTKGISGFVKRRLR